MKKKILKNFFKFNEKDPNMRKQIEKINESMTTSPVSPVLSIQSFKISRRPSLYSNPQSDFILDKAPSEKEVYSPKDAKAVIQTVFFESPVFSDNESFNKIQTDEIDLYKNTRLPTIFFPDTESVNENDSVNEDNFWKNEHIMSWVADSTAVSEETEPSEATTQSKLEPTDATTSKKKSQKLKKSLSYIKLKFFNKLLTKKTPTKKQ